MSDVVIKAEHLSKYYKLGVINNGTFFRDFQTWWALKRGKQDPHSQMGSHKFDSNKEGFWALKDLDFEMHQGDRIGIIGKNGAGKSTLLKILSRITAPTEGNIKINGRIASLLEVGTGFHAELTGRENIYLNGAILGMKRREVTQKLDEIIAFSEIEEHIDTPVKRYSSGMYVRLAFAVAAHLESEILIADEVLAVGDAAFQKKALGKMNDLSTGQGRTVLFVSHNMNQVKSLCKRGIILEKGRIIRQDDDIQKSIDWYLGTNRDGKELETTVWENNDSFKNENFCPEKFCVLDENNEVVTKILDYEKPYKVLLEIQVIEPLQNVDFWVAIYKGSECIATMLPNKNIIYTKGKNVFVFDIPAKSLIPNTYVFSLGSSIKNVSFILNPVNLEVAISTVVNDSKLPIFSVIN